MKYLALFILISTGFAFNKTARASMPAPGDSLNCPIYMLYADKNQGVKDYDKLGSNPNALISNQSLSFYINDNRLLTANSSWPSGEKGLHIIVENRRNTTNGLPSDIYYFEVSIIHPNNFGLDYGMSFNLSRPYYIDTGISDFRYEVSPWNNLFETGITILKMDTLYWKAMQDVDLIDPNNEGYFITFKPDQIRDLIKPLKEAVARGIIKDGELVAIGTAGYCDLKPKAH